MSEQHQSDPGCQSSRPHSPFTGEGGVRGGQMGYGAPTTDLRRSSGPPSIPLSGELYLRNFGHLPGNAPPGVVAPPGPPSTWFPATPSEELFQPMLHQTGSWGASMGRDSPSMARGLPSVGRDSPLPSGFDYFFVPPLDPKYECPICLMCLKDPIQTECGHRFCGDCIKLCLRDTCMRCPVDNEPLTENQMFPDVCVRREILDLQAHCPYSECQEVIELRTIESHKEGCSFRTEPCPNLCGASMRRKSVDLHLDNECPKRLVECQFCNIQLPFNQRQSHEGECPERSVTCEFCNQSVVSRSLQDHHNGECAAVPMPCQFAAFGCKERLPREQMTGHVTSAMTKHIGLLGAHLTRPTLHSNRSTDFSRPTLYTEMSTDSNDPTWRLGLGYGARSEFAGLSERSDFVPAAGKMVDGGEPGMKKPNVEMLGRTQKGKVAMTGASFAPLPSYGSMVSMPSGDPWDQVKRLKDKVKSLQEKEVVMGQQILELEGKTQSKDAEIKTLREWVEFLQKDVKDLREHVANGVFVWRLHGYSELRRAADRGEPTVRHSDGFYTGSCGYRLCIRVNINKSEARSTTFISLFVHFMQGKYDDFLEWPFRGTIKLSIIDQSDESEAERKNISEVLVAKTTLEAFKRPKTVRNHKGFGYMEFASVDSLEHDRCFIKDEMVLIKVEVQPQKS